MSETRQTRRDKVINTICARLMNSKDNLHDIPLFPNAHPDARLGAPCKRLLPHGRSGHVGGHDGSRTVQ